MAILGYNKFDLTKWLETRRLAGWLEIATDGLEAPARQRIAHEIEAHYAEAVSAHLEAGEPESSAQATALAELGDPGVAAANFKKSYLTGAEAKWLRSWEGIAAKPLFSSSMLLCDLLPFAALLLLFPHPGWIIDFRLLSLVVLSAYAVLRMIPRLLCCWALPRGRFLKALALWSSVPLVAVGLSYGAIIFANHALHGFFESFRLVNAALMLYFYAYKLNPGIQIWNKLRKTVAIAEPQTGPPAERIISS